MQALETRGFEPLTSCLQSRFRSSNHGRNPATARVCVFLICDYGPSPDKVDLETPVHHRCDRRFWSGPTRPRIRHRDWRFPGVGALDGLTNWPILFDAVQSISPFGEISAGALKASAQGVITKESSPRGGGQMDQRSPRVPARLVLFVMILFAGLVVASCGGRTIQSLPGRSTQQVGQMGPGARKPLWAIYGETNPGVNQCGPGNENYNVDVVCNVFQAGTTAAYTYQFPTQDCNAYCGGPVTWPTPTATNGYYATVVGPSVYSSPFAPAVQITVSYPGTPPPVPRLQLHGGRFLHSV